MIEVVNGKGPSAWPPLSDNEIAGIAGCGSVLPRGIEMGPLRQVSMAVHEELFESSIEFFTEILGLRCLTSDGGTAVLCAGRGETRLQLVIDDSGFARGAAGIGMANTIGFRHLAFAVEGDLSQFTEGVVEKLHESRIAGVPRIAGLRVCSNGPKQLAYFRGPGGVLLELMRVVQEVDLSSENVTGSIRLQRANCYIAAIDHANVVTDNIRQSLDLFCTLGFGIVAGKHGRLQGKWIDDVTGLKSVDAFYIGLEMGGGRSNVELIQYRVPPVSSSSVLTGAIGASLRGITVVTNDIDGLASHIGRQSRDEEVSMGDGILQMWTKEGVEVTVVEG